MSDHPRSRIAGWILLALAGLALAVALSVTASTLSTQPIGISGEPLRAGDKLAPPNVTRTQASIQPKKKAKKKRKQSTSTSTATATTPSQSPPTATPPTTTATGTTTGTRTSDDSRERHHDGDDD